MSERASETASGFPAAWLVDPNTGYRLLPGRLGIDLPGSAASRSEGVGPLAGGWNRRSPGGSDRDASRNGRNSRPPQWYRKLAIYASGGSAVAVLVIVLIRGVAG